MLDDVSELVGASVDEGASVLFSSSLQDARSVREESDTVRIRRSESNLFFIYIPPCTALGRSPIRAYVDIHVIITH